MSDIQRVTVSQLAFGPRKVRSARGDEKIVFAMVLVPEREDASNYYGSVDGDPTSVTNFPKKSVNVSHRSTSAFHLMTMPAWLAKSRDLAQARQPGLCKSVKWSDEERTAWRELLAHLYRVRDDLYKAAEFRAKPSRKSWYYRPLTSYSNPGR